jgi:hypothetical protein
MLSKEIVAKKWPMGLRFKESSRRPVFSKNFLAQVQLSPENTLSRSMYVSIQKYNNLIRVACINVPCFFKWKGISQQELHMIVQGACKHMPMYHGI